MKLWQRSLAVFGAMAVTDAMWTLYMRGVTSGDWLLASWASALLILVGAFVIVSYTTDRRLILPATAGAFVGTAATMLVFV